MRDGKKCILVADDDLQIREILQLLLSSEGYTVVTAGDGIRSVELSGQDIDLYLLDVHLPLDFSACLEFNGGVNPLSLKHLNRLFVEIATQDHRC